MSDRSPVSRSPKCARAIILAAGRGSRLVMGETLPKPLKSVAGVPLLVRILRTLQSEGITEAVIVVGYRGDQIKRALHAEPSLALKLVFVENDAWETGANGVSLLKARAYLDQDCILSMADHLYAPEIVRRLREADLRGANALAVDRDIERCFDLDDATKVKLDGVRIANIGKEIESYDAIDTGVFRVNAALGDELARVYAQRGDCSLSDGVRALSAKGTFVTVDAGEARWIDVDTPEAHARAEAMVRVWGDDLGDEPTAGAVIDPDAIEQFVPSWVRGASPYKEDHLELASSMDGVARMMSNESPFGPSERVLQAVVEAARLGNRYPTSARHLREKLAARNGVLPDGVILGAGATEMIDLVIRTFVAPGEEVLLNVPTFSMYEARTRVVGGIPVLVPMTGDGFDVPAILRAVTERTKVLFLCMPNNPTGSNLDEPTLRRLLSLGLPTVLDEAYYEFAGQDPYHRAETLARLCAEFPNAIVLRTFSKAFGLAGFRLGYSLSHPAVARLMARAKLPWNVSVVTLAAAYAALEDEAEQIERLATLRRGRSHLERELARVPGVRVIPTDGNFVLCDAAGTGLTGDAIVKGMLAEGVFVRTLATHHLGPGYFRISVGSPDENARCITAFRKVVGAPASIRGHVSGHASAREHVTPDAE